MKWLLYIGLVLICLDGKAQHISKINFDQIKSNIEKEDGPYYYPRLKYKLMHQDSILAAEEYKHLYYGLVFQPYYHPYGNSYRKKEFIELFKYDKYTEALIMGDSVLAENPVDLEVLLKMSILNLKKENHHEKRWFARHYYSFLDVIYKSGDGKSVSSAYVVVSVDHEYMITEDLGLTPELQTLVIDCDVLKISKKGQIVPKGQKKIKELYFNVRMPLQSLSESFKDADLPDPDED